MKNFVMGFTCREGVPLIFIFIEILCVLKYEMVSFGTLRQLVMASIYLETIMDVTYIETTLFQS
jgi:hypothetical protein